MRAHETEYELRNDYPASARHLAIKTHLSVTALLRSASVSSVVLELLLLLRDWIQSVRVRSRLN